MIAYYKKYGADPKTKLLLFSDSLDFDRAQALYDYFKDRAKVYAEAEAFGRCVILKYAQVEDKYDRNPVIPTLKPYPNGCLSNEWSFARDIRGRLI